MRRVYILLGISIAALTLSVVGLVLLSPPAGAGFPYLNLARQPQSAAASPLVCNYTYTQTIGAAIVPGTTDIGIHGDDVTTTIALPFSFTLYDQSFTSAVVSSNGNLQFATDNTRSANTCLPNPNFGYTIYAHWQDLDVECPVCAVTTSVSGSAPNRIFNIEWHATYGFEDPTELDFEVRLHEGSTQFDIIYGSVPQGGVSATVGVQKDSAGTTYTQFECNSLNSLSDGLKVTFSLPPCTTPTATPSTAGTLVGHVTWQGRATQPSAAQMMPITLTLRSAITEVNYPIQVTDASGFFTTPLGTLPSGTYNWRAKGLTYLANSGQVNLSGGVTHLEMGTQRVGDLDGNNVVNAVDFTIFKTNFGTGGAPPIGPEQRSNVQTFKRSNVASSGNAPAAITPVCSYSVVMSRSVGLAGSDDTGNHCDDCVTVITLPFAYQLYDQEFIAATVSSNGNLQFGSASPRSANTCLPALSFNYTIFPHWGDLVTDCFDCGIFTAVYGQAPNRTFVIEWRAAFFEGFPVNFELLLYEGQTRFDVVYISIPSGGASATVGVQQTQTGTNFTQYECNTVGTLFDNLQLVFNGEPCGAPTQTSTPTATPTPCTTQATICHVTGNPHTPYVKITIDCSALPKHLAHGDIYPVPPSGCPAALPTLTPTATPTQPLGPQGSDCVLPNAYQPVVQGPKSNVQDSSSTTLDYSSAKPDLAAFAGLQTSRVRRESAPPSAGPPPRTGPPSQPIINGHPPLGTPNFGPNFRANTDPQSPNLAQQEPSIAVNPKNPLNIVVAAKDERAGTNTKHDWIYTSTDGGVTWINQIFPLRTPTAPYSSDPVVNFSDDGVCYVTALPYVPSGAKGGPPAGSPAVGIQVARSFDGGITFEPASEVTNNPTADKEWTWIDNTPTSPFYHRMYVAWVDFTTSPVTIRLNYSTDRGVTWTQSSFGGPALQFPMPVTLPNGELILTYLSTNNNFVFARSTDGGVSFNPLQTIAPVTWPICPPDNSNCGIWRLDPIPSNAVNPKNGTEVLMWSDGRDDRATVIYSRSTDDGVTWSAPVDLAPSPVQNTYQVMPWVTTDENGTFHAIWYDDRDSPDTSTFHVYYSQSTNNGTTWSAPVRISTAPSDLRIGIPSFYALAAGDYINVTAAHGNVYAAWTDTRSGTGEDIYVVRGIFGGTPTATPTGTPPTATDTRTRTYTPTRTFTSTPTATLCGGGQYVITQATATIVPGTVDIGNHCDDCTTNIAIPFPYRLYDVSFGAVNVSTNGNVQFNSDNARSDNNCLPASDFSYTIFPHWDDLTTENVGTLERSNVPTFYGIFTSTSGSAPNRIFNIEWRAALTNRRGDANFEVRLYEGQTRFDLVYGAVAAYGGGATIGVQHSTGTNFTEFECNTGGVDNGTLLSFFLPPCGTATPTFTGTPPTLTRTPTRTATVCVGNYTYATATATIEPGTIDIGVSCDDCATTIQLPFPVRFYDQLLNLADISSNGNLQFTSGNPISFNPCLPAVDVDAAIMPHWDDLYTDTRSGCPAGGCGVFTSLTGSAPNRVFNIEWRAVRYSNPTQPVNFEIRLYENGQGFDFVYGQVDGNGTSATVGVQDDITRYTEFSCDTTSLHQGLLIRWTLGGCGVSTPTQTPTQTLTPIPCPSCTSTPTGTRTRTPTNTPTITSTPCGETIFEGGITLQDPTQAGRHLRDGNRSTCDFPKSCPTIKDQAARHYDSYTLANSNAVTQCVTVDVSTLCIALNEIFVVAYLDSFNPNSICQNYLADMGSSPFSHEFMSFQVPPGRAVVIVVSEVTTNEGCPDYTLVVRGLGVCGTLTPTPTGTPPTPTNTPTRTATPCGYDFTTATATIVPGTQQTGNHCDDCVTQLFLPFPFRLYGTDYNSANASSNGNVQFTTFSTNHLNTCLPAPSLSVALLPLWSDLITDCANCGVYTSVTGTAPNRTYNIEWRAGYFKEPGSANFETRLYETTGVFEFVYGELTLPGTNATVGVQAPGAGSFNQYECNQGGLTPGLVVRGTYQQCGTPTFTPTSTVQGTVPATRTSTYTPTITGTRTPTRTPTGPFTNTATRTSSPSPSITRTSTYTPTVASTSTRTPTFTSTRTPTSTITNTLVRTPGTSTPSITSTVTGTPCDIHFSDVSPGDYFYQGVRYLYCHGAISGYDDGTFRPYNNTTRGQLTKIVVLAEGWTIYTPPTPTFIDVPTSQTFYTYIETAHQHGIISGYTCGASCLEFRPNADVTRAQMCKIIVLAEGWTIYTPPAPTFRDVPSTDHFYGYIETAYRHSIISGYTCGAGCLEFRPSASATRGQISKIVYNAVTSP